jgi:hypothetical protein
MCESGKPRIANRVLSENLLMRKAETGSEADFSFTTKDAGFVISPDEKVRTRSE